MDLARRFSLICLIAALFGVGLAHLVQHGSRPAYSLKVDTSIPCVFVSPNRCAIPAHRN